MNEPRREVRGWQVACCSFYALCSTVALIACIRTDGLLTFPAWPDDAFYYLIVSRSLALGLGPSADGIHLTTGFHPLWTALLAIAGRLVSVERVPLMCAAIVMQGVFAAGGWWLIGSTVSARTHRHGLVLFLVATLPRTVETLLCGMENTLAFFLLSAHLVVLSRARYFLAGGLLALAILARLDLIFVPLAEIIVLAYVRRLPNLQSVLSLWVPSLVALALWAMSCFLLDGSVVPIHGFLKNRAWPEFYPGYPSTLPQLRWVAPAGLLFGCSFVFYRKSRVRDADVALLVVLVAAALQVIHIATFQRCWLGAWYGITTLISSLWLAAAIETTKSWATAIAGLAAAMLWLSQVSGFRASAYASFYHARSVATAATWLDHHAAGAVAACEDSGRLAFFTNSPVTNIDGVVNNRDFQRALQTVGLDGYLRREHVRYFVLVWPWRLPVDDRRALRDGSYQTLDISLQQHKVYRDFGYPTAPLVLRREAERFRQVEDTGAFRSYVWQLDEE
jgi:hypothetical protein